MMSPAFFLRIWVLGISLGMGEDAQMTNYTTLLPIKSIDFSASLSYKNDLFANLSITSRWMLFYDRFML